jgi:hypothetical protein
VEFQETTQEEKQQSGKDLKPKTATLSAMLEVSGLRLEVTNLQASDFVFMEDAWVPRQLSGQVRYTSPTLQFSGSVNAQWESLNPSGFGKENGPVPLAQIQKGSSSLQGNWTPKIGRPAGIQVNFSSNPTGTYDVVASLNRTRLHRWSLDYAAPFRLNGRRGYFIVTLHWLRLHRLQRGTLTGRMNFG